MYTHTLGEFVQDDNRKKRELKLQLLDEITFSKKISLGYAFWHIKDQVLLVCPRRQLD
jgi:hypothetical protein